MTGLEIVDLDEENVKKFSHSMPNLGFIFIAFLAPWCGHCKLFKPEWEKIKKRLGNGAASNAKGHIITTDDVTMKNLPTNLKKPQGFPTLSLYKGIKHVGDYQGGRNMGEIIEFISSSMKPKQSGGQRKRPRHTRKKIGGIIEIPTIKQHTKTMKKILTETIGLSKWHHNEELSIRELEKRLARK